MEENYTERVELNLHTYMSGFISVIRPREAIGAAVQMGHRAMGITDFESVQSFLEVATCHQKYRDKIKVIYGIRMFANDANVMNAARTITSATMSTFRSILHTAPVVWQAIG